jgi:hypothetical protein
MRVRYNLGNLDISHELSAFVFQHRYLVSISLSLVLNLLLIQVSFLYNLCNHGKHNNIGINSDHSPDHKHLQKHGVFSDHYKFSHLYTIPMLIVMMVLILVSAYHYCYNQNYYCPHPYRNINLYWKDSYQCLLCILPCCWNLTSCLQS